MSMNIRLLKNIKYRIKIFPCRLPFNCQHIVQMSILFFVDHVIQRGLYFHTILVIVIQSQVCCVVTVHSYAAALLVLMWLT